MGGPGRATKAMWSIAIFFLLVALAGFVALDQMIDQRLPTAGPDSLWAAATALLDTITLRNFGDWLLPFVLAFAGLLLLAPPATRGVGWPLLYVGLVQLASFTAAHLSRPYFGRVNPSEAVAGGDLWFAGGNSFPSGHVAFHAGLFFPLIILVPRLWPLWIAPPLLVAAARMMQQHHYLSDVGVSLATAAMLAALLCFVAEKGRD